MKATQADPCRRRVVVRGLVQDVWFRASTAKQANGKGVAGWVQNCHDGNVEAVFEGDPDAVDAMIAFCREGPPLAQVESVEVFEENPEDLRDFQIL